MPLWGATDADESKPKHLTTAQKKEVYAASGGWTIEAGSTMSGNGNTSATPEVLVAIGSLTTSLGSADITELEWITTAADKSAGFSLSVRARFNEAVTVVTTGGTPYLAVTNGNQGSSSGRGPHNLRYELKLRYNQRCWYCNKRYYYTVSGYWNSSWFNYSCSVNRIKL